MLKASKSLRVHWKVKRNKELIKELFEIGFGIYEEGAKCDSQKGAENAKGRYSPTWVTVFFFAHLRHDCCLSDLLLVLHKA